MSLFLKDKDEHSSRVICDLRPLNSRYRCRPPRFTLPSISGLMNITKYWDTAFFTKLDITAYFHSLSLAPPDLERLHPHLTAYPFVFK